jgi:hypothetical protein
LNATSTGVIGTVAFAAALSAAAIRLSAQAPVASTASERSPIAIWASLTLGPGYALNRSGARLGSQAGLFGSYGRLAYGYRHGGASGFDSGGAYDDALLIGWRAAAPRSTVLALVGPARIYDESTGIGRLGIAVAAEAGANARFVGLGASALAAWRPGLSFIAVGLTLDAGFIR